MTTKYWRVILISCLLIILGIIGFNFTTAKKRLPVTAPTVSFDHKIISLTSGQLKVIADNGDPIYLSPADWEVQDFAAADINADGKTELLISLWKSGNFGNFRPFWIKRNDPGIRNHLFVFGFDAMKIRLLWGSSNLDAPNCELDTVDDDHDGQLELLVAEGDYADFPDCRPRFRALWRWNGWGFTNVWRSPELD